MSRFFNVKFYFAVIEISFEYLRFVLDFRLPYFLRIIISTLKHIFLNMKQLNKSAVVLKH